MKFRYIGNKSKLKNNLSGKGSIISRFRNLLSAHGWVGARTLRQGRRNVLSFYARAENNLIIESASPAERDKLHEAGRANNLIILAKRSSDFFKKSPLVPKLISPILIHILFDQPQTFFNLWQYSLFSR